MKISLVVAILFLDLLGVGFVRAQPFLVWNQTYGELHGELTSVVPDGVGGFVIAGYTSSLGARYDDVYLMKIDAQGDKVWERIYGTAENDYAQAVVQSGDGGFVVAGYSNCPLSYLEAGSCDIYLLKIDADGDKVWEKIYGGDRYEWANCVARSDDGGFVAAGGSGDDVYIIKVDANGDKVWERTYAAGRKQRAEAITESGDGGYVLTGFGNNEDDVYVLRIDSEGGKVWENTYGGSGIDLAHGKAVARCGEGFIVAGFVSTYSSPSWFLYLLGLDGYGNKIWEKIHDTTPRSNGNDIIRSGEGFTVVGRLGERAYLLHINSYGDKVWETTNPYCKEAKAITEAGNGGFVFVGSHFYVAKIEGTPYPVLELPVTEMWVIVLVTASIRCYRKIRRTPAVVLGCS